MKFNDAMEEYLLAGRQRGLRKGTIERYRWHLEHFDRWLIAHECEDMEALNVKLVRRWGADIHDRWQVSTTRGAIAAVRGLLRWLLEEGVIHEDIAATLKMPRVPELEQRTITNAEMGELFRTCGAPLHQEAVGEQELASAARNVALVAVLFDSMVRASELCDLKLRDLDLENGLLRVRSGKGGKRRDAPMGPDAVVALQVWLQVRRPAPGVDALFVSVGGLTPGRPLTRHGLKQIIHRLGERAGLERVSPHAFRRGGAVAATLAGAPSRLVQMWGGWSNIKMVELYTRTLRNDPEAMRQFRRYAPLSSVNKGLRWLTVRLAAEKRKPGRRLRRGSVPKRRPNIRWSGRRGSAA